MRKTTLLVTALFCFPAQADIIQKWTDSAGKIHYGDQPAPITAVNNQSITLHNNFDQAAYKKAMKRNAELYIEIKSIEKKEKTRQKEAAKRLDDYYDYLDKKKKEILRNRKKARLNREKKRDFIKLK